MKTIRTKLFLIFSVSSVVLALTLEYLMRNVLTQYAVKGYYLIPILFFFLGLFVIAVLTRSKKKLEDKRLVNEYMLLKTVKLFFALFVILIYRLNNKEDFKIFALVFALFFLLFLLFETYAYFQVEKGIKRLKENKTSLED